MQLDASPRDASMGTHACMKRCRTPRLGGVERIVRNYREGEQREDVPVSS
jgi:hypothetical protein